jgi:hypothetical protein
MRKNADEAYEYITYNREHLNECKNTLVLANGNRLVYLQR